ncbi:MULTISPECIES: hypothetical protein [unclassified Chryseobacterium]
MMIKFVGSEFPSSGGVASPRFDGVVNNHSIPSTILINPDIFKMAQKLY